MAGGIQIDLISREKLSEMTPEERIRFIVDEIKAGKVLVLERGLTAKEELELIRVTMAEIDHESFIGVETPGFSVDLKKQGLFNRLLGRKPPPRMMVVGPAHMLRTIKKDGEMVQAMIVTKESMGQISMDELPPPPDDWEGPKKEETHEVPPPPAEGGEAAKLPEEPGELLEKDVPPTGEAGLETKGPEATGEGTEKPPEEAAGAQADTADDGAGQAGEAPGAPEAPGPAPEAEAAAPAPVGQPPDQGEKAKQVKYHSLSNYPEEPEADEDTPMGEDDETPKEG